MRSRRTPVWSLNFELYVILIAIYLFNTLYLYKYKMKRNRIILFIFFLNYTAIYFCRASTEANKVQLLQAIQIEQPHKFHLKDSIRKVRSVRDVRASHCDSHIDIKQLLPKQNRTARGVAESRRHLRVGDAHQVANYFLTGGPLKGHAHFVKERNCEPSASNDENNLVGQSNPNSPNADSQTVDEKLPNINSDSIVGEPNQTPLHPLLGAPHALYQSAASNLHSLLNPVLNTLTGSPLSQLGETVGAPLHHALLPHLNTLNHLPHSLMQTAMSPLQNLLRMRTEYNKLQASLRAAARKLPKSYLKHLVGQQAPTVGAPPPSLNMPYPQPTGYIVQYVPHVQNTVPSSPVVGSPQDQSSECVDDSDTEQNTADPTQDENENPNADEETTESQNENINGANDTPQNDQNESNNE